MGFVIIDDRVCIKVEYTFIQLFQDSIQLQSGLSSDEGCNNHITASTRLHIGFCIIPDDQKKIFSANVHILDNLVWIRQQIQDLGRF